MTWATGEQVAGRSHLEPREEHDLRIWTAIAMWMGGACAIATGAIVLGARNPHLDGLWMLVGLCVLAATVTFLAFRSLSNSTLYLFTNIFSALGALTIWLACLWSGGAATGLMGLYFFPSLYAAYFFRFRHALAHVVIYSALVISPLFYAASIRGTQFPARAAVLLLGMWAMSAVVGRRKRTLLIAELNARRGALSDPLTGLHNLRSLRERAAHSEPEACTAVLEIDIDDFKAVNTAFGHTGADEFLRAVGAALVGLAGEGDCVARIGGDEFAMLVRGRAPGVVEILAAECASAVRRASAVLPGRRASVTASVGYALRPQDGHAFTDLLAAADRRMYNAKADLAHRPTERTAALRAAGNANGDEDRPPREPRVEAADAGPRPKLGGDRAGAAGRLAVPTALRRWWGGRPANAVAGAVAWLAGAVTTSIVLLLPDTDTTHAGTMVALIIGAVAVAAFVLVLAPLIGRRGYLVADALSVPSVAFGVYLTGGIVSPLLPLVLFAVTVAACFTAPRGALVRLLGAVVVCASPFAYSDASERLAFIVRFIAIVTTAGVLVSIILYNRRELARAEKESLRLASHDPLTGLPNRRAFQEVVSESLRVMSADPAALLSVSIIDLDNFKRVNDRHGHAAGDRVLKTIASALTAVTRREDTVARIGGDEFALIASGADTSASVAMGERCVRAVEDAVVRAGYADCEVSATVGYAVAPFHGETLDALVEAADSALMQAKGSGKRMVAGASERASAGMSRPPVVAG
jgi:diguanylate cyclase (GGDEF)-like protein